MLLRCLTRLDTLPAYGAPQEKRCGVHVRGLKHVPCPRSVETRDQGGVLMQDHGHAKRNVAQKLIAGGRIPYTAAA